ncbi:MAG TPA: DUF4266 domain-containing protein [Cellvibrio sp.]|nr:DUF4266 domain-containing protein [Cellvibrio sp.]
MILQRFAIGILFLGSLTACGWVKPIKPWVKPYERQNIADPIMSFSRDPVADSFLIHVRDAREGASGADGGVGGGCGCN